MRKPSSQPPSRSSRSSERPGSRPRSRSPGDGDAARTVWIYGHHAVVAALGNPSRTCAELLLTPKAFRRLSGTLKSLSRGRVPPTREVGTAEIDSVLPQGAVHQGIALKAERLPGVALDEACAPRDGERDTVVVLDRVTDPRNVGAVLRSAAAFGARAVVLARTGAPAESGSLATAASGAWDIIPCVRAANLARALDRLAGLGYWRVGLAVTADSPLSRTDLPGPVALVLGAEGGGLRRLTAEKCDRLARLPTRPDFPSLNVSTAAAVALYEVTRDATRGGSDPGSPATP